MSHQSSKKNLTKTLGEIDYLYQDNNGQLNHLEIAVKFYLLKPDKFGFERLIGPNGSDWYERKLLHLFNKQLALSDLPEAKKLMHRFFYTDADGVSNHQHDEINCHHQGLIKGMIFLPLSGAANFTEHEIQLLNPSCLKGYWGTINNWYLADPGETGRWLILDKLAWLEPQRIIPETISHSDDILYTAKEMAYKLKAHFHNTIRSVLIVQLEFDAEQNIWLEQQRVMVVDKYWPSFQRTIDTIALQSQSRSRA